jgi:hypothetical protein
MNQIKHLQSVMTHINMVRHICVWLNGRLEGTDIGKLDFISKNEIKNHDASKFSQVEINGYVKQFYTNDKDSPEWRAALMHHYQNNPHHWQYWLIDFNEPYTEQKCKPKKMPVEQVLIMVADWLAASLQYQGHADMSDWLNGNLVSGKIVLHPETRSLLDEILNKIGFTVSSNTFGLKDISFVKSIEFIKDADTI